MEKNNKTSVFKNLLDKLQEESWQLELLISGFAIFGLFSAIEPLQIKYDVANYEDNLAETILWYAASVSCWILIANLLIHVILRGLWIGALGLRYVSGDIDYDELNYSEKFTNFLKKRIGSFDNYIESLEKYCSILFAVTFLFIFYFLACLLFIVLLLVCIFIFLDTDLDGVWQNISVFTGIGIILIFIFGAILTFIDFITQGFLKKKRWASRIYFPFYKIFSLITLSFLYRPIVYNFLDNKFSRRLVYILIPVYVSAIFFSTFSYQKSNFLALNNKSNTFYASSHSYEDQILKENDFTNRVLIPSKVIKENYLKVFLIYNEYLENNIFEFNEGLEPKEDRRGLKSSVISFQSFGKKRDSLTKEYFNTFNFMYSVYIDSKKQKSEFISATNKFKKLGFEAYVNIDTLKNGKHVLKIARKSIRRKDTLNRYIETIPFWKFNN